MNESVKIAHKVAKEKLIPLGFVRIGNTTHYALDCGYFMIDIHYMPRFGDLLYQIYFNLFFEKTEVLDGAVCKDWYNPIEPDVECMRSEFCEDRKEKFEKEVLHYTDEILKSVYFFLKYEKNIKLLVKDLEGKGQPQLYWRFLIYGQLCLLAGEYEKGILYLKKSLKYVNRPRKYENDSEKELKILLLKMIHELFTDKVTAQQEMVKIINKKRMIYSNINRFSRMHLEKPFFLPEDLIVH